MKSMLLLYAAPQDRPKPGTPTSKTSRWPTTPLRRRSSANRQWPSDGMPTSPRGWLLTVARRSAIDVLRREARFDDRR